MIHVVVVDDHDLIRLGTTMTLSGEADIRVVGEASNGSDAVDRVIELRPDVVLMDIRMPGVDGIEATRRIAAAGVPSAILVLTTFDLDEYALSALDAGASGFLLKDAPPVELVTAVRTIAAGEAIVSPRITRRLIELHRTGSPLVPTNTHLDELTDREREVLAAIGRGLNNTEIGAALFLSESTVKSHVGRILAKLQLRDRIHAVILARDIGLR